MSAKDTGGAAFPQIETCEAWAGNRGSGYQVYGDVSASGGMTLRDYFAAKAPPPPKWWMDSYARNLDSLDKYADVLTQWAYCYADSMLAARKEAT